MYFPTTLTVEVTQADINAGIGRSCYRCPIALTASRRVQGVVYVEPETLQVEANGYTARYTPGKGVAEFIDAFDNDTGPVAPATFEFYLDNLSH